jgi:hypothetical protein
MHPDVTASEPGRCPRCNMRLIAGDPFDTREYILDLGASPGAVGAGEPFTLSLRVRHPGTGAPVRDFEVVHDKRFHLFLVSHDMSVFQHAHPDMDDEGTWTIETLVPSPGYYRVLSDFVPTGGSPQFIGRTFATAGFDGDLGSASARLVPDTVWTKTAGTITASVSFEPAMLVAGQYGHLDFSLSDAATGRPVTDLERYLDAYGHTLILSDDLAEVVHAHPSEWYDERLAHDRALGGPHVRFEGYLPRPGMYRAWTQFQRHGELTTFTFTFRVWSAYEVFRAGQEVR